MFFHCPLPVSEDLTCRDEVHERIAGVSNHVHKKYKTFQDALFIYTRNYNSNRLRVVPVPGSRIWNLAIVRAPSPESPSSDDALWRQVDDLSEYFNQVVIE